MTPKITASPSETRTRVAIPVRVATPRVMRRSPDNSAWLLLAALAGGELLVRVRVLDQVADTHLVRRVDWSARRYDVECAVVIHYGHRYAESGVVGGAVQPDLS